MKLERRQCDIVAALLGAPNVGKTSLFNALTGRAEAVANWPGVTVDIKTAVVRRNGTRICIVDLPGAYGLSGSGPEEKVTRDFILREKPDVIIALAESTNLEKSLYLPLEAREATSRVVVVLTKMDAAREQGISIDLEGLSKDLDAPVVATSALREEGLDELVRRIPEAARREGRGLRIDYGGLERYVEEVERLLDAKCRGLPLDPRWLAVRLLEGLEWTRDVLEEYCGVNAREVLEEVERLREEYRRTTGHDPAADAVAARYRLVEEIVRRRVVRHEVETRLAWLDNILMHPAVGPVASLLILLAVFFIVFTINTGFPLNIVLDALGLHAAASMLEEYSLAGLIGSLFDTLSSLVKEAVAPGWLASLLADGVIGGVGLVLSFTPLIATVYAIMGLLEDTGIAPRMAVAFDPWFRRFGLSGKSLFPAVMSLGCNVPAVMATRILESRRERLAAMLALPLIPCQARLAVLLAFVSVFFAREGPAAAAAAALGIYLIAFAAYLFTAWLFTRLLGGGGEEEYVLEIPPLKKPSWRVVWWYARSSIIHFLERAGTVILVLSVVTWLATSYTPSLTPAASVADSIAAALGKMLAPLASIVFGVGHDTAWRLGFAFIEGLVAKEVFLDALAMTAPGGLATASPEQALAYLNLTPAQAFAVLVAVTLYIPCIATLATIYAESRSLKLTLADLGYTLTLATILALLARVVLEALV